MREYAVYRGDTFVELGSAYFLAMMLGVKESTIKWHSTKAGLKRALNCKNYDSALIIIKI